MKNTGDHRLRRAWNEPLLHFVLIALALFAANAYLGKPSTAAAGLPSAPARIIVVSSGDIDQVTRVFAKTWQRPPTPQEEAALIEDFVRNEIYCREAVAIGLDRDDAVIRRRLRQKMEFLQEDIASWTEPTDAQLRSFMQKHREKYLTDPEVAFRQVYVDLTRRGPDGDAESRRILARLQAGADPDSLGDRTMLEPSLPLTPVSEIGRLFGDRFATSLLSAPVETWSGPVRSGYGLHLVLVRDRTAGRLPDWNALRERVKQDWTVERQRSVKDAAYVRLRASYDVKIETRRSN